jgi:predicted Ser/Thr protein kinase
MKPAPMIRCPKCSAEIAQDSRFCKFCGQAISAPSQMPTMVAPEAAVPKVAETPHVARIISSDSIPAGGFTPGTILADRYRVIGLLGRGGMGEVYRADDLKLGQPVALKFLPPRLAEDPVRRERFFAEVRITRQLSHPNICRVYDIGEIEGRHFLSMEFIDGEDLASLLKRIGHLSNEKALDVARQLAAGLAAAHERGVLHRDLKPANIMLDGHGRVRITDFGLAIAVEDESQASEIAGTPAYMAPEQLAGKGATIRSDIYSLGLVLYEVYTGKKAFTATTLAELREQKETHTPRAISEIREGIDPVVERLIRRCMEKDPNARPASMAQLALALPGGDPLAAAIAAGETPSPEMVAASGSKEGLRPAVALGLIAFIVVGLVAALAMKDRIALYRRIPFDKRPETMVERSHEILKKLGFTEKFKDSAYGFMQNSDLLNYQNTHKAADLWEKLNSKAILFWYRQSPRSLNPELTIGSTSQNNPPLRYPGEVLVILESQGRLVGLRSVPSRIEVKSEPVPRPDWNLLFTEAGLDISQWKQQEAQWIPDSFADDRAVWEGALHGFPEAQTRIEAASFRGKPVSFGISGPWVPSTQVDSARQPSSQLLSTLGFSLVFLSAIVGGIFFARRNMRLGRGDRRNANRLALFVLSLSVLIWALEWPRASSVNLLIYPCLAILTWILYVAVEPFVRRRWPQVLVSWTRLLSGELRDPLVARDILIGCAFGVLGGCVDIYGSLLPLRFLTGLNLPATLVTVWTFDGPRRVVSAWLSAGLTMLLLCLAALCVLVALRVLLRNQKAAIAVIIVFFAMALGPQFGFETDLVFGAIWLFVLMRFGFITAVFVNFITGVILSMPMTLDTSAWYSGYGFLAFALFGVIVLYAFRTSLGGRPLIAAPNLDD